MGTVWALCGHWVGTVFFHAFFRSRLLLKLQDISSWRRGAPFNSLRPQSFHICPMAPQFTPAEVDYMQQQAAAGHKPPEVLRRMAQRRARRGLAPPDATSVRMVLKGKIHARAKTETRGRKPSLSPAVLQKGPRPLPWVRACLHYREA